MSKRANILDKLKEIFDAQLDGINYTSNIYSNSATRMLFPDTLPDYPYLCMSAGRETRDYLPNSFKWGYLEVTLRLYIHDEDDTLSRLEPFLEDIESVLDANNEIEYETGKYTRLTTINTIVTDEGLLMPMGIGEIQLTIQYDLT